MNPDYKDQDLSFYLEGYRNFPLADWCVGNIRRCYPGSRITVISDGDPDPAWDSLKERHKAGVIYGERLWRPKKPGKLWRRRIEHFRLNPTAWIVKTDTDTGFYKRLSWIPSEPCIFGTARRMQNTPRFITGGFVGMAAVFAEKLLKSEMFNTFWYSSEDQFMGHVAAKEGVPMLAHPEVLCEGAKRTPDNPGMKYAVVHPRKSGTL